jgi:hypothetical protein
VSEGWLDLLKGGCWAATAVEDEDLEEKDDDAAALEEDDEEDEEEDVEDRAGV